MEPNETTFGCGHTNHGSCSQCLGQVTNERNDLLRKTEEMEIFIRSLEEKLKLSANVVEAARHQGAISDYTVNNLLEAVAQYDAARASDNSQAKEEG